MVPTGPQLQALDRSSPHRTQCQTATSGFKVIPAGPQLQALDRSGPCQTGTARSQPSLPDLNSNLWIKVIAARQTSTASSRSHFSLPNSNSKPLHQSDPRWPSTARSRSQFSPGPEQQRWIRVIPAGPPLQAPDQSVPRRTSTASSGSECCPPDFNHKESQKI